MGVARTGRAAAREVGEQVAEIEVLEREAAGTRTGAGAEPTVATVAATPVGWRLELLARAMHAELVVGGALLGIAQRRVGLGDFLELALALRILGDVRMVLAREPAIGLLDVGVAGVARDTEHGVVVGVLHGETTGKVTAISQAKAAAFASAPAQG